MFYVSVVGVMMRLEGVKVVTDLIEAQINWQLLLRNGIEILQVKSHTCSIENPSRSKLLTVNYTAKSTPRRDPWGKLSSRHSKTFPLMLVKTHMTHVTYFYFTVISLRIRSSLRMLPPHVLITVTTINSP